MNGRGTGPIVKVAIIRDPQAPMGQPAPCWLKCPCGARPVALAGPVVCTCGRRYSETGWVQP